MKRLLAIELQKIWKNRASRILTLTYFILLTCLSLIASIKFDIGPIHIRLADQGIFNFPFIWHFNTYVAALLKIFLAVVIVSMMANEYSYGTLKQNLIDGMSKKEFVLSKFLTVVFFAFVSTVFVFIMSLILGLNFSSYTEFGIIFSDLQYLLAYFVKLIGFFSFCLFLGVLIKRSAFAIGFLFVWFLGENISHAIIKYNFYNGVTPNLDKFYSYMPLESMSNLIIEPGSRLNAVKTIGKQIGVDGMKDYSVHFSTVSVVLCWTALFIFLSYKIIQKRDL
ncbi:MAG TPA: ABC transporter permease [Flavobacterium sp.]|uniref:ABC transporter permease n=1 Tax=Flavobacterium sp. TaxID=239 RepID=UPI002B51794E|nr:ABC transporter permease [Flavobacterium sp.]HNP33449.1 ABC transporter permease [Flavobacterium sp.]